MATKKRLHQTFDEVQEILDRALVQPDWNETDPESDAYIRNRTHWEDNGGEAYLSWEGDTITEETLFKVNGVVFTLYGWWPEANTSAWSGEIGGVEKQIMIFPTDGYLRAQFNWRPIGTAGIAQFASLDRRILQTSPCDIGLVLPGEGIHKLDNKYLDLDSSPVEDSGKPITSGGVYEALEDVAIIGDEIGSTPVPGVDFNAYTDTVWNKEQTLSQTQKDQVKANLGITCDENLSNLEIIELLGL